MIYHLDPSTLQLLPLDSVLPSTETDETRLGKRAAVFRDELELVPLARPAAKKAKRQANGGGDTAADAMEEDDEDLYGGSAKEKTKANGVNGTSEAAPGGEVEKDRIVRPQEVGGDAQDRWEWLAEVDAKGDFKVRFRQRRTRAATHADRASPRRSASCLPASKSSLPPPSPCFPRSSKTASRTVSLPTTSTRTMSRSSACLSRTPGGMGGRRFISWCVEASTRMACTELTKRASQILLTSGKLAVYEAFPSLSAVPQSSDVSSSPPPRLAVRFVKTLVRHLPSAPLRRKGAAAASDLPPPRRDFLPFSSISGHAGVLLSGEEAFWLLKGDHSPARCFESSDRCVYGVVELGGGQQRDERGGPVEGDELAMQTREVSTVTLLFAAARADAFIARAGPLHRPATTRTLSRHRHSVYARSERSRLRPSRVRSRLGHVRRRDAAQDPLRRL